MAETRPLPKITEQNRPFWEGTRSGELRAQRCLACGRLRALPQDLCPHCLAEGGPWVALSGKGTLSSWCVYHRAFHPAFADAVPYVIAQVDLAEGIRYIAPLRHGADAPLVLGLPVRVVYESISDEVTLPLFEAERAGAQALP